MAANLKALFKTITALDPATTNYDWTGFGFDPKACLFIATGRNDAADAVGRGTTGAGSSVELSIGAGSGAASRGCATSFYSDNAGSVTGGGRNDDAAIIQRIDATGALSGSLDFNSFITDGVRVTIDDDFSVGQKVMVIGIGGDDITNVAVKKYMTGTSTGDAIDFTGLGFDPGDNSLFIFFGLPEVASAIPSANEDVIAMSFGLATSNGDQYSMSINNDDDSASADTDTYSRAGDCLNSTTPAGSAGSAFRAIFIQSITDGFRLDIDTLTGSISRPFFVMVIKGGSWKLFDLLTQTDTTTDIVKSGFGFQPVGAVFVSHCQAQSPSPALTQTGSGLSIGACTGTSDEICHSLLDENGTANMETSTAIRYSDVYARISAASAIDGAMRAQSFPDATGFTMRMSDADPAQAFVFGFALGNSPVPGTGNRRRRFLMSAR